jgi:crotonobetainyl-CoA:carnitine CoA-transferase CaiB-like acyl-CoA transferase
MERIERLPLLGVRVLDFSKFWAGPYCTRLLGDMGAEVIKVESPRSWDMIRSLNLMGSDTERAYNKSAYFNHYNRNKYGCAIELDDPQGRELVLRLAAKCDAVVENYRVGVLERLRLTYDDVRAVRPDVVYVSMPSHGSTGPDAQHVAYGTNIEQLSGLLSLTGYADGPPQRTGLSYGDPIAGAVAAAAVIAGLLYRRWTGHGQHIEVAQWEAFLSMLGEHFLAYSLTGEEPRRRGNRHSSMAPHGAYRCAGEDSWVTIAVGTDAEFEALCAAIGRPEVAGDARFADVVSRHHHQDELDAIISEWTTGRSHQEAAVTLQAAGVTAAPVLSIPDLAADPHLSARGFLEEVTQRDAGTWPMESPTWRFDLTPPHVRLPAPCFGEHNDYVLGGLLGLSKAEIEALEQNGVVSREPAPGQDA